MKIKVADANTKQLEYLVAKCEGKVPKILHGYKQMWPHYTTDWSQMGPISKRERISIHYCRDLKFKDHGLYVHAEKDTHSYHGYSKSHDEPLLALCRCYVISKLGEEVDVPELIP